MTRSLFVARAVGAWRARVAALAVAALGASSLPSATQAQEVVRRFSVTTRGAVRTFDRASSLRAAPLVGLDAEYALTPFFGLGTAINATRANTYGEDFVTTLTYGQVQSGDTTTFYETSQAVNMVDGSLLATVRMPNPRFSPFLTGGVGYYAMFFDASINRGQRRHSGAVYTVGGGASLAFSERAGIQLDVRDMIMANYDASLLEPSGGRSANVTFIEDFPRPPGHKGTINSLAFSLGFRYVPDFLNTAGGSGEGGNP